MALIVSVGTNTLLPQNEQLSADSLCTYIVFKTFHIDSFRSVVVITCALHAQGPRFEPGRKQIFISIPTGFSGFTEDRRNKHKEVLANWSKLIKVTEGEHFYIGPCTTCKNMFPPGLEPGTLRV